MDGKQQPLSILWVEEGKQQPLSNLWETVEPGEVREHLLTQVLTFPLLVGLLDRQLKVSCPEPQDASFPVSLA